MFKLILCCDNNYGIGKDNKLPWCVKKELWKYFATKQ